MGSGSGSSLEPPGRRRTEVKQAVMVRDASLRNAPHHETFIKFAVILRSPRSRRLEAMTPMGID